jgi:hypothetical protein
LCGVSEVFLEDISSAVKKVLDYGFGKHLNEVGSNIFSEDDLRVRKEQKEVQLQTPQQQKQFDRCGRLTDGLVGPQLSTVFRPRLLVPAEQ